MIPINKSIPGRTFEPSIRRFYTFTDKEYPRGTSMQHVLKELNSRIPELEDIFATLTDLNQQSVHLSTDIQNLFDIWGEEVRSTSNPDYEHYQEKAALKTEVNQHIQKQIEKIQEMGGVVKDMQKGLVDFYIEHQNRGLYLCWKVGESTIKHWHPLRGGFSTRRPIEELSLVKQR